MDTVLMCRALEDDCGISLIRQGKYADARKYYEEELKKVIVKLGKDHPECLNLKEKLAFSIYEMGSFLEAKEMFAEIVRERESIYGISHPLCLRLYMLMSVIIKTIGDKSGGDLLYAKLSEIQDNMDKNNDEFAISCLLIAFSYQNLFKTSEAEGILEELLQKEENSYWNGIPLSLLIKVEIGHILLVSGKYTEATARLEGVLNTYSDLSEKQYILNCLCRMDIAICCYKMSKFPEAKIQLEEILRVQTVRIGNNDAESRNILTSMAQHCLKQHVHGEAKSVLGEVLNYQVEIYGKGNFFLFNTTLKNVNNLISKSKFSEAKDSLEWVLNKIALDYGRRNQLYLNGLRIKATLNFRMGYFHDATAIFEDLLLKQLDAVGKHHSDYLKTKSMLADVHCCSGKVAESMLILKDILRLQSSMYAADYQECMETKIMIARMCMKLKMFVESATLLKEVVKSLKEKLGDNNRKTIDAMALFAGVLFGLGKEEEATPILEVVIRKMEATGNKMDMILDIRWILWEVKQLEICRSFLQTGLKASNEILGEYHGYTLLYQTELSSCLLKLYESAEAKEVLHNVLAKLPKMNPQNDELLLCVKERIAHELILLDEHEQAVILLEQVLKKHEEEADDCVALSIISMIASSLSQMGRKSEMKSIVYNGLNRLLEIDWEVVPWVNLLATNFICLGLECEYHTQTMNLSKKLMTMPKEVFEIPNLKYLRAVEFLCETLMKLGKFAEAKDIYSVLLEKTKRIHGEGHREFRRIKEKLIFSHVDFDLDRINITE